jgi:hypothetical protein
MAYIFLECLTQSFNMKTPVKIALVTVLLTVIYTGAKAQKLFFVFAHGQYCSPVQTAFKDNYGYGLGGEVGAAFGAHKTFFTGTIGYSYFDARSGREGGNLTIVPMKLGIRRYLLPANLIYLHADAGVATIKDKGSDTRTSGFTADVGGGVKLGPMELGVAYDGFSYQGSFRSFVAFKAGWRFGL